MRGIDDEILITETCSHRVELQFKNTNPSSDCKLHENINSLCI